MECDVGVASVSASRIRVFLLEGVGDGGGSGAISKNDWCPVLGPREVLAGDGVNREATPGKPDAEQLLGDLETGLRGVLGGSFLRGDSPTRRGGRQGDV